MRFGQTPAGYSAARVVRFRTDSRGTLDYILTNSDLREAPVRACLGNGYQ
jgi:hypothetical protein